MLSFTISSWKQCLFSTKYVRVFASFVAMFFLDSGSTTCLSAVESLLCLSSKFIMMGGCSSMLRLYLPWSRPVLILYTAPEVLLLCRTCLIQAPIFSCELHFFFLCPHNVRPCSGSLLLLSFYVGIRQARMAAIAGTRPSITTNAIIIEMIAAIFFWQACVGVRVGSGSGS